MAASAAASASRRSSAGPLFARPARHSARCAARPPARRAAPPPRSGRASGSMNSDTRIPAAPSRATIGASRSCCPTTSSPPSVVSSSRLSGTMQTACGRGAARSPHLGGRRHLEVERDRQLGRQPRDVASGIWRRSSRRCAVMPSAPASARAPRAPDRDSRATRVPHGRDVVDVDAESQRGQVHHAPRAEQVVAEALALPHFAESNVRARSVKTITTRSSSGTMKLRTWTPPISPRRSTTGSGAAHPFSWPGNAHWPSADEPPSARRLPHLGARGGEQLARHQPAVEGATVVRAADQPAAASNCASFERAARACHRRSPGTSDCAGTRAERQAVARPVAATCPVTASSSAPATTIVAVVVRQVAAPGAWPARAIAGAARGARRMPDAVAGRRACRQGWQARLVA